MLKKGISAVLLIALLLSLTVGAAASGLVLTASAPQKLPEVGQTFSVPVKISGNPGFSSMQYTIAFDQTVVQCTEIKLGGILGGMMAVTNEAADSGAIVVGASVKPVTENGTLSIFTFQVIHSGDPAFSFSDCLFADTDGTELPISTEFDLRKEIETQETIEDETLPADYTEQTFSDVPHGYWGFEAIEQAARMGLVTGNPDGTFRPENEMTRAEFVTMLYRLSGDGPAEQSVVFDDVASSDWFFEAVNWAAAKGYATGSGTAFHPNGKITRQEVVTILYRYHDGGGMETLLGSFGVDNLSPYTDRASVASWAEDSFRWAIFNGIINGTSAATLSPVKTATRAQVAAIFVRYSEFEKKNTGL